jgi:hypothetical protein
MSKHRKDFVWMLNKTEMGERVDGVVCAFTFRSIYKLALFNLAISMPSMHERQAREQYKKTGECMIYNMQEFETIEEAQWSPVSKIAIIKKVPLKQT